MADPIDLDAARWLIREATPENMMATGTRVLSQLCDELEAARERLRAAPDAEAVERAVERIKEMPEGRNLNSDDAEAIIRAALDAVRAQRKGGG